MKRYNPTEIEPKWQQIWADDRRYVTPDASDKPKYYVTGMFPYPSGAGMHIGHFFEHSIVDGVARFRRALGYNVMYPMGFDNFGLPAENYAIKTGVSPQKATADNIANFKNQLNRVGASIDWDREVQTSDPGYYKWTQWVFTQLFERGLAYQKEANQWWCDIDKTVLANEQVINGKCWRHEGADDPLVTKKKIKQWFFKITDYADALLEEIPSLDWPDKIKTAQENWIGRSVGAEIEFSTENSDNVITVFSTRPDTLFGATFLVLAPEHPLARQLATDITREAVNVYIDMAIKKSEIERQSEGKEKTGVFTGSYAINPANGEKVQIWIADYVLGGYGTGAVMGVPAHDERDFEFATKFDLPTVQVIANYDEYGGYHAPRADMPTISKPTVDAIIIDQDGQYLLQIEDDQNVHFVGGGIDDTDESVEDAIRREVREETGYTDVVSIRQAAPFMSGMAFRATKARNQKIWGAYYEVVIGSKDQVVSELDEGKHTQEWVNKDEVAGKLTWKFHQEAWQSYLEGKVIDSSVREGLLVNSGVFDGTPSSDAREQIVAWLEQQGRGRAKTTYKMRDWLISRQRYWGAPIPIIHCSEHGAVAVPEDQLPVVLPEIKDFAPKGDGKTALAAEEDWVNTTCPTCGGPAQRETDTMDGYACSSWYLLRYTDPHNAERAWDPEKAKHWAPLDMYVGGDHAVAHLLYVRFWNHVFYDMGLVPSKEPVKKLVYHGLIQAEDGRKMSKSLGNVVDPLEVIDAGYGADALRTFELFLGPINEDSNWSSRGIAGVYRFLNRLWALVQEYQDSDKTSKSDTKKLANITHATIKKVTEDIYKLNFNTAIAAMMECVNDLYKLKLDGFSSDWQFTIESLVQLVQPFAPHMAAELWQQLGHDTQLDFVAWPVWSDAEIVTETITIIVQVNGKLRAKLEVAPDRDEDTIKQLALDDQNVQKHLDGKQPRKVIYVRGRLVSVVV